MSEKEQVEKLKDVGISTVFESVKKKVIDSLSAYGEKGISPIAEIVASTAYVDVKEHGLDTIKKIKEKSES